MEKLYYTYIYLDPRKPGHYCYSGLNQSFLFEPFYVGKGKENRMNHHINAVECGSKYVFNSYKVSKIKKIIHEGLRPYILIYESNLKEKKSFNLECTLIKLIGRKDKGFGPLCNFTDGGEGSSGRKVSEETKRKIKESLIGKKASEKTKEKMRKNNSGSGNPNFGKHGVNNAWFGKKHNPDSIEKMKNPKTKEELYKRKKTRIKNSKNIVNISGRLNRNNISIIEACELTGIEYKKIYYGIRRYENYKCDDWVFSKCSGKANSSNDL